MVKVQDFIVQVISLPWEGSLDNNSLLRSRFVELVWSKPDRYRAEHRSCDEKYMIVETRIGIVFVNHRISHDTVIHHRGGLLAQGYICWAERQHITGTHKNSVYNVKFKLTRGKKLYECLKRTNHSLNMW